MVERDMMRRPRRRSDPLVDPATFATPSGDATIELSAEDGIARAPTAGIDIGSIAIYPPERPIGPEGGEVSPALASRIHAQQGGGAPLEPTVQREMEAGFGHNFADVRVHADGESDTLNRSLSASAFTLGSDIFLRQGAADARADGRDQLLAHELTHVVQQRAMPTDGPLTVGPMDDGYEREASAAARSATATGVAPGAAPMAGSITATGAAAVVQRAPINMPGEVILTRPKGVDLSPTDIFSDYLDQMKEAVDLYWSNYHDGLSLFQSSMNFATTEEVEAHYLSSIFKAGLLKEFDELCDVLKEHTPAIFKAVYETTGNPFKVVLEMGAAAVEEHHRVEEEAEKAEGQVKIYEFIRDALTGANNKKDDMLQALTKEKRPLLEAYSVLAQQEQKDDAKDPAYEKQWKGTEENDRPITGEAAKFVEWFGKFVEWFHAAARRKSTPWWQQEFAESFAKTGPPMVGETVDERVPNGTLHLSLWVAEQEGDPRYYVSPWVAEQEGDPQYYVFDFFEPTWHLATNAPDRERVVRNLNDGLAGQDHKMPYQAGLYKIVHVEMDGHEFTVTFMDIDADPLAEGTFPGHDPSVMSKIWRTAVREEVMKIEEIR